jgi:hypothetical protein
VRLPREAERRERAVRRAAPAAHGASDPPRIDPRELTRADRSGVTRTSTPTSQEDDDGGDRPERAEQSFEFRAEIRQLLNILAHSLRRSRDLRAS